MAKFSELGIETDVVVGRSIIQSTKYPGKNSSNLRMQMQVVLASPGLMC